MIEASELPLPLAHAFLDALEAWSLLEHDLFMLWQFLSGSRDITEAWETFSRKSTERQRKETEALVRGRLGQTRLPGVFDRLPELTRTRDRLVHGRWRGITVIDAEPETRVEYLRIYDARGEPSLPRDDEEERQMLGRSRFYEPELREAQTRFREAARDLHLVLVGILTGEAR